MMSSIWGIIASGGQLIPIIIMIIEIIKRFIPDQYRTWANPIIAILLGVAGVYVEGGMTEVVNILLAGLVAGAGAVGAYKIPKVIAPMVVAGVRG